MFGKGMVIAAYAKSNTAITLVCNLGEWHRIEVEINHIVKGTYYRSHLVLHCRLVGQREPA